MAILGNAVKGSIVDRENGKVLSQEQIKEIQRVLLMVLEDIDAICREYGLKYSLIGGTAIGCMRHKGFIPWDDDVDIAMTRKDYEIFRVVINNKCSEKYSLTDARRENNYGKNIPKLRLKQTEYSTLLKVNPLDKEITSLYAEDGAVNVIFNLPSKQEKSAFNPMENSSLDNTKLRMIGWKGLFDSKMGTSHTIKILRGE